MLSPLLFNIYMKVLGEVICHFEVQYHYYVDETQLCILIPKSLHNSVKVLGQCPEGCAGLNGEEQIHVQLSEDQGTMSTSIACVELLHF